MFRKISGPDIRAQVHFEKQIHKGTFLVLEGPDDAAVLQRFTNPEQCSIIIAHGKKNVIEACDLLEEEGFDRVYGIVDADFDRILGKCVQCAIVCLTDCHDLDLTIFHSRAFESYLIHFADKEKVAAVTIEGLRRKILAAAEPIARMKYLNQKHDLRLDFKDIDFSLFINKATLVCDEAKLVDQVFSRTSNSSRTKEEIVVMMEDLAIHSFDLLQLCVGHDVAAILGIALREFIGCRRDVHTWRTEIESGLRLAFDRDEFIRTQIFQNITRWAKQKSSRHLF